MSTAVIALIVHDDSRFWNTNTRKISVTKEKVADKSGTVSAASASHKTSKRGTRMTEPYWTGADADATRQSPAGYGFRLRSRPRLVSGHWQGVQWIARDDPHRKPFGPHGALAMITTPPAANLVVGGGLLCLKRPGRGHRGESTLYQRTRFVGHPFFGGMTHLCAELPSDLYEGRTFAEPADAERFTLNLLAA